QVGVSFGHSLYAHAFTVPNNFLATEPERKHTQGGDLRQAGTIVKGRACGGAAPNRIDPVPEMAVGPRDGRFRRVVPFTPLFGEYLGVGSTRARHDNSFFPYE